ncbi:PKD domain-containing protein, partial [Streptosporangium fragile]|uniref:PKD domain-containing protein n=1 Tax=Streptosporangium fragile TaxID=46186 RepID=UPI0031E88BFA
EQRAGGGTVTATKTFGAARRGYVAVMVYDGKHREPSSRGFEYVIAEAAPNTAPVLSAGGDVELTVGEQLQRTVTVTDPDSTSWTATVNYGDGSGDQRVTVTDRKVALAHTWSTAGTYTVTVTVTDDGGEKATATFTVTVVPAQPPNQAPTVTLTGPATVTQGTTWVGRGTFTDPDSTAWTYTADYGAGPQELEPTAGQLKLEHAFTAAGTYTVILAVTDNQGATGTAQVTVTVTNAAPAVQLTAPVTTAEVGQQVTLTASFTDPGRTDTHTATWTVGDRTVAGALAEHGGKGTTSLPYVFTKPGIYPIAVTVTDTGRGAGTADTVKGGKVFVRVYDRSGALTGAGTVASPAGSCRLETACESEAGEASFTVTAHYPGKKGGPKGELRFTAPGFSLTDASYDVLVAASGTATLRGTGKAAKTAVTFEVTGVDTGATAGHTDQLRFRAWDDSGRLVYDNQPAGAASPAARGTLRVSGRL